jgi:hypothetical protein
MGRRVLTNPASSAILHSFPNPRIFLTTDLIALQGMYAGSLQVRVNETVYMDALDMLEFLRADTSQQGNANSSVATVGIVGYSAWEGNRAFYRMTPNIAFNGLGTNIVQVNLPESLALACPVVTEENVAVFIARGFNIQNGAKAAN